MRAGREILLVYEQRGKDINYRQLIGMSRFDYIVLVEKYQQLRGYPDQEWVRWDDYPKSEGVESHQNSFSVSYINYFSHSLLNLGT